MEMIDDACSNCEYFDNFYGCINHNCPIWQEYEQVRNEMFQEDIMSEQRQIWKNRKDK